MAFLGGLLGNSDPWSGMRQATTPGAPQGQGILGGLGAALSQLQQQNPEFLQSIGNGLMSGDVPGAVEQGNKMQAIRQAQMRADDMQREGWGREDQRFAQSFGLNQQEFDLKKQSLASDAQEKRALQSATADFLEANGADPSLVQLARAGQGAAAFKAYQDMKVGADPDLKEIYDENGLPQKGYFKGGEWVPVGGSKMPSNGVTIGPDGAVQIGGPAKMTDSQRRNSQLTTVMEPELKIVEQTFGELSKPENQAGGMLGKAGNFVTTEGYQRGRNSLSTIVQSYIYSTSGAAAPASEVQATTDALMPQPGESEAATADKLARIKTMTEAVRQSSGPRAEKPAPLDLSGMSDAELESMINGE